MKKYLMIMLICFGLIYGFNSSVNAKDVYSLENTSIMSSKKSKKKLVKIEKYQKLNKIKNSGKWVIVKYNSKIGYIPKTKITNKKPYTVKAVPKNKFKSYMSYTALGTGKRTEQSRLQSKSITGKYGIRTYNGRYCIALGSYYTTKIGTNVDLVMTNGEVIKCVLGDMKSNRHTDALHQKTIANGCLVEFIVDLRSMNKEARRSGDMSKCDKTFGCSVKEMRIYRY